MNVRLRLSTVIALLVVVAVVGIAIGRRLAAPPADKDVEPANAGGRSGETDGPRERPGDPVESHRWNPESDTGQSLKIGRCEEEPCVGLTLLGIDQSGTVPVVRIALDMGGVRFIAVHPLRKGCTRELLWLGDRSVRLDLDEDASHRPGLGIVVVRRQVSTTPLPGDLLKSRPRWARQITSAPPGRIVCGDDVYVCSDPKPGEQKDDMACLQSPVPLPSASPAAK